MLVGNTGEANPRLPILSHRSSIIAPCSAFVVEVYASGGGSRIKIAVFAFQGTMIPLSVTRPLGFMGVLGLHCRSSISVELQEVWVAVGPGVLISSVVSFVLDWQDGLFALR